MSAVHTAGVTLELSAILPAAHKRDKSNVGMKNKEGILKRESSLFESKSASCSGNLLRAQNVSQVKLPEMSDESTLK